MEIVIGSTREWMGRLAADDADRAARDLAQLAGA